MLKKVGEDGPDVKGGELDALIVHATKVQKISENGNLSHLLITQISPFQFALKKPFHLCSLLLYSHAVILSHTTRVIHFSLSDVPIDMEPNGI